MTPDDGTEVVHEIVRAVGSKEGVAPTALPPLAEAIDTDALASLLTTAETDLSVEFTYLDYRVVVDADGSVRVIDSERNGADAGIR